MELSRIIYGCAGQAMLAGEDVSELLDQVLDLGINVFDTAQIYGKSEDVLGNWIKTRKNRDRIHIITKGCHPHERDRVTPEDLITDIENSFRRLHTDYIDTYLLHRDDRNVEVGPLVEVLNEYHKAGKIGRFGGSNWTVKRILEANEYAYARGLEPFTVSSPHYGIALQVVDPYGGSDGCIDISGNDEAAVKDRRFYEETRMPVLAFASLGNGFLTGRVRSDDPEGAKQILNNFSYVGYCHPVNFERLARVEKLAKEKNATVPQIAIAWILNNRLNAYPIVSSNNIGRFKENVAALNIKLTREETDWLVQ